MKCECGNEYFIKSASKIECKGCKLITSITTVATVQCTKCSRINQVPITSKSFLSVGDSKDI